MSVLPGPATIWFILGVVLLVVEAMHLGVLAVFFALGAWVTAILMWLGIIEEDWLQLAVFLVVSVVALFLLRRKMRTWLTGLRHSAGDDAALDDFVGNLATVVEAIEPARNTGKVEFRGTQWAARSDSAVREGSVVKILARDNLTLTVQPNEEIPKS
jgi:membrane protein implicated in regulation of membrane protease activity